jgi:hypothetical protein
MAKKQHCLMCGEVLYEMTNFGEPSTGVWPPLRDDPRWGTVLVCPECDAEHLTFLDDKVPDISPVRRVRCLKPPG